MPTPDPNEVSLKSLNVSGTYNGVLLGLPEPETLIERARADAKRHHGEFVDSLVVETPVTHAKTVREGTPRERTFQYIPPWRCMVRFSGPPANPENFQAADIILLFWQDTPNVDLDAVKARALTYWADHAKDWEW